MCNQISTLSAALKELCVPGALPGAGVKGSRFVGCSCWASVRRGCCGCAFTLLTGGGGGHFLPGASPALEERLPRITSLALTHTHQARHRNIWQPPHCPLCPGAIRPVILLGRDMSHLGACHIESHFCHGTDAPCIQQGEWHLEGSLTSWSGSSSWKTR